MEKADLDAIRARHVPDMLIYSSDGKRRCKSCRQKWGENGCDAAIVLATLDAAQVEFTDTMSQYEEYRLAGQAAIERERRLREAAQRLVDVIFAEAQAEPFILPLRGMRAANDTRAALATTPEGE